MLQECWNHANPTHEVKLLTSNCFISRVSIPGGGGKLSEEADEPTEDEEGEFGAAIVSGKSTGSARGMWRGRWRGRWTQLRRRREHAQEKEGKGVGLAVLSCKVFRLGRIRSI